MNLNQILASFYIHIFPSIEEQVQAYTIFITTLFRHIDRYSFTKRVSATFHQD
jgi:hypothetical protein